MNRTKPLRIAIVGFGNIAVKGHLPTYLTNTNVQLVAVVDPVIKRLEAAKKLVPDVRAYASLDDLLNDYCDGIDAVDICSPPVFHVPNVRTVIQAGKHVLCEKPVALHYDEACDLVRLAREHNRVLHPCSNYLRAPSLQWVIALIRSGQIGRVKLGSFQIFRIGHAKGVTDWQPDWRKNISIACGGILADFGPHLIYISRSIMHYPPTRVAARTIRLTESSSDIEDSVFLFLEAPEVRIQMTMTWAASVRKSCFIFSCEGGDVIIDGDEINVNMLNGNNQHLVLPSNFDDSSHSSWFRGVYEEFANCIMIGNGISTSVNDLTTTANVIEQAYLSDSQGGKWVNLRA